MPTTRSAVFISASYLILVGKPRLLRRHLASTKRGHAQLYSKSLNRLPLPQACRLIAINLWAKASSSTKLCIFQGTALPSTQGYRLSPGIHTDWPTVLSDVRRLDFYEMDDHLKSGSFLLFPGLSAARLLASGCWPILFNQGEDREGFEVHRVKSWVA